MYVNVYTYENDIPQRLLTCQTSASIPQFDTQTYMAISSGGTWQRISVPKSGKDVSGESIFLLAGNLEHWWPSTPWKINMEPANQPFRSENHLPNHHFQVQAVHLSRVHFSETCLKLNGEAYPRHITPGQCSTNPPVGQAIFWAKIIRHEGASYLVDIFTSELGDQWHHHIPPWQPLGKTRD